MLGQTIYDIKDVLTVVNKGEFPYSNKVTKVSKNIDMSALHGPGIYAIFHHRELIYIGIYAKDGGNVADSRWRPHIQALTLRGYNSAFNSEKGMASAKNNMSNRDMLDVMDQKGRWAAMGKTPAGGWGDGKHTAGAVSSERKADFAHQNWEEFALRNSDTLFKDFEFHYIQLPGLNKKQLEQVEGALVAQNNPVINKQGRRKDSHGKTQNISGIISIVDFYNNIHKVEQKVGHILKNYTIFKPLGNNDLYDHKLIIQNPL